MRFDDRPAPVLVDGASFCLFPYGFYSSLPFVFVEDSGFVHQMEALRMNPVVCWGVLLRESFCLFLMAFLSLNVEMGSWLMGLPAMGFAGCLMVELSGGGG